MPRKRQRPEYRGPVARKGSERSWRSQRPVQHCWSLHQRDDVEQDDEHAEGERNRDRARTPAALLLLAENDLLPLFIHAITSALTLHRLRGPIPCRSAAPRRARTDRRS